MAVTVVAPPANGVGAVLPGSTIRTIWNDANTRKLNLHLLTLLLGSFICGYDGSVIAGFFGKFEIAGIGPFYKDLGNPSADLQGLYTAAISLGYIIGFIPASYAGDKWGRKWPQVVGAAVVIAGVFVQVFAISGWKFFGARIMIGAGAAVPLTLGSSHIFEIALPRQGATLTSLFAAFYWVGAIIAAWVTYGTSTMTESNWSWRIPALLQGLASVIQLVAIPFVPESPRYLAAQGRVEQAHEVLAYYHAGGDKEDPLVVAELSEINTALELEKTASTFGYLDFFKTPANRKRLFIALFVGVIVQWVGNGIISCTSNYLIPILSSVGIASTSSQQGLNGGLQIWNFAVSLVGVKYCQTISRRALWLGSTAGCLITYSVFTGCSAAFERSASPAAGKAAVAMIFLYNACYTVAYTNLFYTYVLEVLPYKMRTKGMSLCLVVDYAALFFNQYVNPIGFTNLGYRYYFVYIGCIVVSGFVIYFYFPETANLTLEESAALLDGNVEAIAGEGLRKANAAKAQVDKAEDLEESD